MEDFMLDWVEVSGRDDPKQRYRIYRLHHSDVYPFLLGTCKTEEDVGVALCMMGREGQLDESSVGVLDTQGEKGKKWVLSPFLPQV